MMFFLGAIFALLWGTAYFLGRKIDPERAAWDGPGSSRLADGEHELPSRVAGLAALVRPCGLRPRDLLVDDHPEPALLDQPRDLAERVVGAGAGAHGHALRRRRRSRRWWPPGPGRR